MAFVRSSNVGGMKSGNPIVAAYDERERGDAMAMDAAKEIVGRRPRDINGAPPWWASYFRKLDEQKLGAELQGKSVRTDFSGFGNGMSARQGGPTVARSGSSPFGRPPVDEAATLSDRMADADAGLLRSQQLRANDSALLDQSFDRVSRARDAVETPDFDLFSGRAGARAKTGGDIGRSEFARDAGARARTYFDPDVTRQRESQVADEEKLLTARYGREADAQAKIEAARIAAGGRVGAAQATAQGGLDRGFLTALSKARENQALLGGDPAEAATFERDLRGNIPGLQPNQGLGIDTPSFEALLATGQTPMGRQQLIEQWPNLSPEQQARVRQQLGRR